MNSILLKGLCFFFIFLYDSALCKNQMKFLISESKFDYNDAIMYCSDNDLKIAYLETKRQFDIFLKTVKDKSVWIIGLNSTFYNNDCMYFQNSLYKSNNCSELRFAACNSYQSVSFRKLNKSEFKSFYCRNIVLILYFLYGFIKCSHSEDYSYSGSL